MKKLFLIMGVLFCFVFAKDNKYLDYTTSVIHYQFKLKNFNKIKSPFENDSFFKQQAKRPVLHTISINIKLISIFNKNAYIVINKYLGNKLIKSYKKWVKEGDIIEKYYKVKKITLNKIILKYKNKIIIKTLNKKIPGIKEK